jgi:peptide/nickel transport system permease protein
MGQYLLRRLLQSLVVLLGVTILDYAIISFAPGDPVDYLIGGGDITFQTAAILREKWGLDDPIHVRYIKWLGHIVRGNLGISLDSGEPVASRIGRRFGPTLLLMGTALALSYGIAVPLGVVSALKRGSFVDAVVTLLSLLGVCLPNFFLGLIGIYVFALQLKLVPTSGMYTIGEPFSLLDRVRHMALPASILAMMLVGSLTRYTRSSVLETLGQDYVRTARAKGLRERVVLTRHALRNALLPLITLLGLRIPWMFGGAVIVESVFGWPGMGLLLVRSSEHRDYSVLMGLALVAAVMGILGNLIADMLYSVADPRIRLS